MKREKKKKKRKKNIVWSQTLSVLVPVISLMKNLSVLDGSNGILQHPSLPDIL